LKKRNVAIFLISVLILLLGLNYIYGDVTNTKTTQVTKPANLDLEYKNPEKIESPSYFSLLLKTLIILIVFGVGIYYIFKYISKKQGLNMPNGDIIKLVSNIPVGTNRFVQLISVGTHYFLIGNTEAGINLLSEITDNESINMIQIEANKVKPKSESVTFIGFIKDFLGYMPKGKKDDGNVITGFLKRQKERLKNM